MCYNLIHAVLFATAVVKDCYLENYVQFVEQSVLHLIEGNGSCIFITTLFIFKLLKYDICFCYFDFALFLGEILIKVLWIW